jgi:S1-C subfamily serine protease
VVAVNVAKKDGSTFTGTGFVVTPDGLIATNKHVVQDAIFTNITFNTGVTSGEAIKMASADKVDLTLLKIEARNLPYVVLGDSDTVLPGQTITVIGNPRRLQNTVSSGLISQVRQKEDGTLWHQISAPISPSSSGSPVFNAKGEVVCVAFASYSGEGDQNLNFAVPVNYLRQLITEAGFSLPQTTVSDPVSIKENPILAHIKKAWTILMRLIKRNSNEK